MGVGHVCIDLECRWRWDWGKSPNGFIQNEAFFRPKMLMLVRRMMVNYHQDGVTIEFWGTRTQQLSKAQRIHPERQELCKLSVWARSGVQPSVLKLAPWTCFGTMTCTVAQGKQSQLTWLLEVIFCIGNHYNHLNHLNINQYNFQL